MGPAGPEASSAVNMALVPWKRSKGSAAWARATVVNAMADRNIVEIIDDKNMWANFLS